MIAFKAFWHGPPLGPTRTACLNSFLRQGHSVHLYVYTDFSKIPEGVEIHDANSIIPEEEIVHFSTDGVSLDLGPFSDLFRFKLLKEQGGWWTDVDVICLSSDIPDVANAWTLEGKHGGVGTSQLCMEKQGLLATEMYDRCKKKSESGFEKRVSLGPELLTHVIQELDLPSNMNAKPSQFYPLSWIEMFKLWLPEFHNEAMERVKDAYFLPIYQSFPTWAGLGMNSIPPIGSLLEQLLEEYSPTDLAELSRLDSETVRNRVSSYLLEHSDWTLYLLREVCSGAELERLGIPQALV